MLIIRIHRLRGKYIFLNRLGLANNVIIFEYKTSTLDNCIKVKNFSPVCLSLLSKL